VLLFEPKSLGREKEPLLSKTSQENKLRKIEATKVMIVISASAKETKDAS